MFKENRKAKRTAAVIRTFTVAAALIVAVGYYKLTAPIDVHAEVQTPQAVQVAAVQAAPVAQVATQQATEVCKEQLDKLISWLDKADATLAEENSWIDLNAVRQVKRTSMLLGKCSQREKADSNQRSIFKPLYAKAISLQEKADAGLRDGTYGVRRVQKASGPVEIGVTKVHNSPVSGSKQQERMWTYQGQDAVKAKLRDGDSAKFKGVFYSKSGGTHMTCGYVNAKNGYGAYMGNQRFVSAGKPSLTYLESEVTDMDTIWQQFCR